MASFCITLFDSIENPGDTDACFVTATKNLTINKGSSYRIKFLLSKDSNNVDLTGYSLRGQIRPSSSSSTVLLNMTSANLLLAINNSNSTIEMNLPESFTRRVTQNYGVYDIELLNNIGEASKIVTGLITFIPEVTQ
jgi:hypothetical protein